jgi:hypothetical protein
MYIILKIEKYIKLMSWGMQIHHYELQRYVILDSLITLNLIYIVQGIQLADSFVLYNSSIYIKC